MSALVEVLSLTYADKGGDGGAPRGTISVFDGKRGQVIYRGDQAGFQEKAPNPGDDQDKPPNPGDGQNGDNDVIEFAGMGPHPALSADGLVVQAPSGTISVFDGNHGQTAFQDEPPNPGTNQNEKGHELRLTGPYRAISADGCVVIELDLHHGCRASSYIAEILIDIYDDSTEYDVAVTEVVNTCNCDERPSVEVTYALLSDAVEASVEVTCDPAKCFSVHKIIALSDVGEVMLFESNEENTRTESLEGQTIIPLARSVLAVPLGSFLKMEVHLHGRSNTEIMKRSMKCDPDKLDSKHELHLDGEDGQVNVKIALSD